MTRDEEFARLAAEYAEADDDVNEAERQANQMRIALEAARKDREALKAKLSEFVGANVRTRNAVVGSKLVRAEYIPSPCSEARDNARIAVSVEDVTVSRGDA